MNSFNDQIDAVIRQKGREVYLPLKERLWLRNSLYDSFRRLDILQELLDDKEVTEIMINGAGKIFIEKKGKMLLWNRRFEKTEQLEDIIQQIVGKGEPYCKCVQSHCRCQVRGWFPCTYCSAAGGNLMVL